MALFKNLKELLNLPKKEKSLCMVVSEQEGAEIWLNGRRTPYQTPRLIMIAKDQDVLVEVRQSGFETHRSYLRTGHPLSFHYCDLKRIPLRLLASAASPCID